MIKVAWAPGPASEGSGALRVKQVINLGLVKVESGLHKGFKPAWLLHLPETSNLLNANFRGPGQSNLEGNIHEIGRPISIVSNEAGRLKPPSSALFPAITVRTKDMVWDPIGRVFEIDMRNGREGKEQVVVTRPSALQVVLYLNELSPLLGVKMKTNLL